MAEMSITRVVTGVNNEGKAVFTSVGTPRFAAAGGMDIGNVWGTPDDGSVTVGKGGSDEPVFAPFFPEGTGTRLCVVHWPPAGAADDADSDGDAPDPEAAQPGLIGAFEEANPGMHTTETIDYGICLSGEIYLELDDGQEQLITPGTIVVQRGTRHAWRNRSNEVCTMVYALCGAKWADS
ncbi:cupin domain-containing protein [Rhodococcus aetherivorans]|uniref:cupin domain-containing protein n=1 Tax=Rhodococcus TaxID=1827 RepID=UPI0009F9DC48|nr:MULTISPECIES: cupin domain-containing protein [Rhodococcus]MBC2592537.1 cupin domain-containing protein [Rhodococcus aetherivorans]